MIDKTEIKLEDCPQYALRITIPGRAKIVF